MDAETRHQLKTNDLAETLQKLTQLNDPRIGYTLLVILVALVAWFGYRYFRTQHEQKVAAAWRIITDTSVVGPRAANATKTLEQVVRENADAAVAAVARLNMALADQQAARQADDMAALDKVAQQLLDLANDPATPPSFRAAALYDAGVTREDQHRFDEARKIYSQLLADPKLDGSPYKKLATNRLEQIDKEDTPIVFLPGLPEVDIENILPTTQPASAPSAATPAPAAETPAATQPPAEQPTAPTSQPAEPEPAQP